MYSACSRNQLSVLSLSISHLELLQVLLISNNKLVSLPEEIGRLKHLMQLVCHGVFISCLIIANSTTAELFYPMCILNVTIMLQENS